ncbi:MAG: 50S ribosomal protein L13 [Parcubacteria group bacterium]|nr:50S ribosomal protein L13 [Parcubacteria group bacterium]
MKTLEINAEGEKLGRIATKAAAFLMGKNDTSFARNVAPDVEVKVVNASKMQITDTKKSTKIYKHYTGYPGGLREEKMGKIIDKKGYKEIFKKAVYGMLPNNKLRPIRMKKLIIEE